SMKPVNGVVDSFKESIFSTITQRANRTGSINLSQGFPDFDGPEWALALARNAFSLGLNQYAPSYGTLPLREAIQRNHEALYGLRYEAAGGEILVTNGATEAIYSTITALVNPGDEVIVLEPAYDSYIASLALARGVGKVVPLKAPEFRFDMAELRACVTPK